MEQDFIKLKDIKPALTGYLRDATELLQESAVPDERIIHNIRVLMKKSRALLKLISPQITDGYIDKDIESLKEVGRLLSSWRETSVHRKTLKEFKKKYPELFSSLLENEKLNSLINKSEQVTELSPEQSDSLEKIRLLLNKTGYRIRFQAMIALDPHLLLKELEVSYLKVTEIYISCRNNPRPEKIHKFRKKTKDFLYQLSIFRPINPSEVKSVEKRLDLMAQNLGNFNDLSQIINTLEYDYKNEENPSALNELIIRFREVQDEYLDQVWPSAYRIFCPGRKLVNVLGFKVLVI